MASTTTRSTTRSARCIDGLRWFFGAHGQIAVGVVVSIATAFQAVWWGLVAGPPNSTSIYWLSVEALFFAAYGIIATGLGYRATERVEQVVVEGTDVDVNL